MLKITNRQLITPLVIFIMFSRFVTGLGIPSVINFVHYFIVGLFILMLLKSGNNSNHAELKNIAGLIFISIMVSTIFNLVSPLNAVLDLLIVIEPFLLVWVFFEADDKNLIWLYHFFWFFSVLNFCTITFQFFVLGWYADHARGIFLSLGAGSHISGGIAITSAIYFAYTVKGLKKYLLVFSQFLICAMVDDKQSLLVLGITFGIFMILQAGNIKKLIKYIFVCMLIITSIFFLGKYIYPELFHFSPEFMIEGIKFKISIFSILKKYFDYSAQMIWGMGPGHSINRLAQMFPDYPFLTEYGCSFNDVYASIRQLMRVTLYTADQTGSSMFSLLFSWSGIFGDLGLLGVIVNIYGFYVIYKKICINNLSKLILISCLVHSCIFYWLEEPSYICMVAIILALSSRCEDVDYLQSISTLED